MGSGSSIKYSNNIASSKVSKAAAKGTNAPFSATCFTASYTDTGLFGYQIVAQAEDAEKVMKSVRDTFAEATKGGITDADIQRAKNQLKAALLMELESPRNFFLDLGLQAIITGQVLTSDELAAAIDKITTTDVQNIAKKVIGGKPAMAAVGFVLATFLTSPSHLVSEKNYFLAGTIGVVFTMAQKSIASFFSLKTKNTTKSDESDQTKKPKLEQVEEDSPIKSKAIRKKNHCVIESDSEDEMENRPPNEGKSQEDNDEQKPLQGEPIESSVDGQPETSMTPRKVTINDDADVVTCPSPIPEKIPTRQTARKRMRNSSSANEAQSRCTTRKKSKSEDSNLESVGKPQKNEDGEVDRICSSPAKEIKEAKEEEQTEDIKHEENIGVPKKKAKSVLNTSVNSDKMAEEHKGENEEMTSVQGGKASSNESQLDDKAKHPSENDTSKHSDKKQEKSTASNHGNKTVK
ncbi:hypothetical protein LSH36_127g15026 [Paralvinella palmiformis]|uniref:Peptidase M16 C-terminal domain-containing protein n=1 Tax=Paralvinella palmiformis TaxID=53620 RepID=A0AAD9JXN8_9ANNE|nr:hypothetical protein LSH36_127g15026 [Paralvinella palmiformis]